LPRIADTFFDRVVNTIKGVLRGDLYIRYIDSDEYKSYKMKKKR
jgi:hypothetical protein